MLEEEAMGEDAIPRNYIYDDSLTFASDEHILVEELEEVYQDVPKEYINDESLAFVDPEESKHERIERSCGPNEKLWIFKFKTDNYGYETSWQLEKQVGKVWETLSSGPPINRKYHDETTYMGSKCLEGDTMYKLTVSDAYKDGFCCQFGEGYYMYSIGDVTEYDSNRKRTFDEKGEHSFYVGLPYPFNDNNGINYIGDNPFSGRASTCGRNRSQIKIKIRTDKYGAENSWQLRDVETNQIVAQRRLNYYGANQEEVVVECVQYGEYTFTMTDGIGDGICCKAGEGKYELYMDDELMVNGSDFTYGKKIEHTIIAGYHMRYDQLSQREKQYLQAHNWRRQKYHTRFGKEYVPLKYDMSLARDAMSWATDLLDDCNVNGIEHEPGQEQGENLAKNSGNGDWGQLYPVENICRRWFEREEAWEWPGNAHFTQGLWRSARYVGCAESQKTLPNGGMCRVQVCRYARAGNCNMGAYKADPVKGWETPMLMDHNPCGPICPPNGCH